jgi:hypothetical protein
MNKLLAGFGRLDVTPPLGIPIVGYYKPRFAEGVLDELEVNALALAVEDKKVVLLSVDNCGFSLKKMNEYTAARMRTPPFSTVYKTAVFTIGITRTRILIASAALARHRTKGKTAFFDILNALKVSFFSLNAS